MNQEVSPRPRPASARQPELTADAQQAAVLTVDEAHAFIGRERISRGGFYSAIKRGQVPHVRLGYRILIPRHALLSWLEAAGSPSQTTEINAMPELFDPWAGPAWDFVLLKREAWQAAGKSAPFHVSVDEILEALAAPSGKSRTRFSVNRLCRILRRKGLIYQRQRIFSADGSPVYVGDTARQLLEYHFRWPEITAGACPHR